MGEQALYFFFNDTATTEIYTLSLHDALPISETSNRDRETPSNVRETPFRVRETTSREDRKSTRLNSSHANISYAVFCLKKKKNLHTWPPHLGCYVLSRVMITRSTMMISTGKS